MNNLLRLYSNHADAPDIPNEMSLIRLLEKRIVNYQQGKMQFEHIYETEIIGNLYVEYKHIETIDHEGDERK